MADDLSINVAKSMMHMLSTRTSSELSTKLIKMQSQQDQAIVAMLDAQVANLKSLGYNSSGGAIAPIAPGSVDTAA
jgi:hypothetical protein